MAAQNAPYTHIIHLADIHIRTGNHSIARVKEYNAVFNSLYDNLKQLPCIKNKTALIVLCGDIFHNKTKLESTTVKLWNNLRNLLTQLAPVVLICGNHDYRQEDSTGDTSFPDIIEVLLEANVQNSCTYLSETGTYDMGNIVFSLVSIKDTLKSWDSHGIREELPEFPLAPTAGKLNIGLFHGTITQSALPNGQCMAAGKGYPLEWFKGVDLLLLGDNHKQQLNISKWGMPWAYPGSLIQQDHGEPTRGHGYILWDLKKVEGQTVHIPNNYGFVKMRMHENECQVRCDGRGFLPIEDVAAAEWFPRQPTVAVIGNLGDEVRIRDTLKRHGIMPVSMTVSLAVSKGGGGDGDQDYENGEEASATEDTMKELATINNTSRWLEYINLNNPELALELQSTQWLERPEDFVFDQVDASLSADLASKVKERREKLMAAIQAHKKLQERPLASGARSSVVLKHMKWSWAFSYGERNHFNFETLEGNIALLNGPNASGKSAFVDVLFIALFGEPTKSRSANTGRKMSSYFIHNQRPPKSSLMNVALMFEIDGVLYEIKRSFGQVNDKQDRDGLAQARDASLSKVDLETNTKTPVEKVFTITDIDNWIVKHCGTIDATSMTTIVNQFDTTNFFMMKPAEQRAVLDQALNMETFKSYAAILHDTILAYNALMTMCTTVFNTLDSAGGGMEEDDMPEVDTAALAAELDNQQKRALELERLRDSLQIKSTVAAPVPNDHEYWKTKAGDGGIGGASQNLNSLMEKRGALLAKRVMLEKEDVSDADGEYVSHSTDELIERLTELREELESHAEDRPANTTASVEDIEEELKTAEQWLKNAQSQNMEQTSSQYHAWVQAAIPKPVGEAPVGGENENVDEWEDLYKQFQHKVKSTAVARSALATHESNKPAFERDPSGADAWDARWQEWTDMLQEAEDLGNPSVEECTKNVNDCQASIQKRDVYKAKLIQLQTHFQELSTQLRVEMHPEWLAQMAAWEERLVKAAPFGSLEAAILGYDAAVAREKAHAEITQKIAYLRMRRTEWKAELQTTEDAWGTYQKQITKATKHNWLSSSECSAKANQAELDLQKSAHLTCEIDRVTQEYNDLCAHPFNPKCDACKTHPSHQRKLAIGALIQSHEAERDALGSVASLEKVKVYWQKGTLIARSIETAQPMVDSRRKMEAALVACENEVRAAKAELATYDNQAEESLEHWASVKQILSAIETERPMMQSRMERHKTETVRLQEEIAFTSAQIQKIEKKMESYGDVDDVLESWERALEVRSYILKYAAGMERERVAWEAARKTWVSLEKWNIVRDKLCVALHECEKAESVAHWHAYTAWVAVKERVEAAHMMGMELPIRQREYESLKIKLQNCMAAESWLATQDALEAEQESIVAEQRRRQLKHQVEKTAAALSQVDADIAYCHANSALAWFECQDVKERLAALQASMRGLTCQLALLERTQGFRQKRGVNIATLKRVHQKWMATRDMLVKVNTCLVGAAGTAAAGSGGTTAFVEWMYSQHILPLFQKQINCFLRPIDHIHVQIQYAAKGTLSFLVHDRGNVVAYSACSGYQKFIIGLAVRQGLARIGGGGCNLSHMVLDESFTACDEQNLAKVELVLRHLMRLTECKSIILISHLDTIKDAIAQKVGVVREGAFSTLRYGQEYPPLHEAAQQGGGEPAAKKRGRPKKV